MSSPKRDEPKATASSSGSETQLFTLRGRPVDAPVTPSAPNPLGEPLMGRRRSNSIRRLPIEHLQGLAEGHASEHVRTAATREIAVRKQLVAESAYQFSDRDHPKMSALGPVGMAEVQAARFASSLAEEAHDELLRNKEYLESLATKGAKIPQLGQLAVARVGPHMGVGFSGKSSEMDHTRAVEKRMLELQAAYEQSGATDHWSSRLAPVQVTDIFAEDGGNICAAKRAAHVAHALAKGSEYLEGTRPVRSHIPLAESTIEMMTPAMSGRGRLLTDYSASRAREGL